MPKICLPQRSSKQSPLSHQRGGLHRLTICADDFGLAPGIDAGIIELVERGRVSAVSCLVDGPSLAGSATALARQQIDLGLHLNFTEPIGVSRSLQCSLARLIVACSLYLIPRTAVRQEIERQFDRFEQHFGRAPDFVDGHQHVHQLPVIRDELFDVIRQRTLRPWIRSTRRAMDDPNPVFKARVIAALGDAALRSLAAEAGLATNRTLLGVYDFSGSEEDYRRRFFGWLHIAQDGDLLMCHPALSFESGDSIGLQRCQEFSVLVDPMFDRWLRESRITIASLLPVRSMPDPCRPDTNALFRA